jgi:hypothetical protein
MTCVHLKQLYQLCQENELRFSGSDLVHIVCQQCGEQEVCPSVLSDEYEAKTLREQTLGEAETGE